ncbi:MAG: glycosyltransferase, partial [Candidatus Peregrinibacteria bacterium]|nr:glycosyltransferase [Candidatus Peregrinibacteria bacterium]
MRIGIDARMYSSAFTGIGRYVYELTERLFQIGKEHEWVLFMNEPEYSKFTPPNDRVKKVLVNAKHYSWTEQWDFWKTLNREKLDLVHFTHFNAPLLYRKPSVVTIHDLTLSFFPGKKMNSPIHRMAYHLVLNSIVKRAKGVIAVSKNTKLDLIKLSPVKENRVRVIYEAAGEEFKEIKNSGFIEKTKHKYRIKGKFILYTGVWRSHKNLVNLIKSFGQLCKQKSFKGQLVMTGREDPFYPEIKNAIRDLHLMGRVVRTGLVNEKEL